MTSFRIWIRHIKNISKNKLTQDESEKHKYQNDILSILQAFFPEIEHTICHSDENPFITLIYYKGILNRMTKGMYFADSMA